MVSRWSWSALFAAGACVRLFLVVWGSHQDAHFAVRYTDVDYVVFSDSARFAARGASPYERATFRYTPFLAYLFVPNEWLGSLLFGKMLLVVCDLLVAHLLRLCAEELGLGNAKWRVAAAYLLNPLILNITTRGNTETITILLLLACFYCLIRRSGSGALLLSAACLGLAAHVRLFPVLNGFPIAIYLLQRGDGIMGVARYGSFSVLVLVLASVAAYGLCGMDYLNHAVLYHATRSDHRHSLSAAFPLLYMKPSWGPYLIVPQMLLAALPTVYAFFSPKARGSLEMRLMTAVALQNAVMVAASRVLTVQYFAWWIPFVGLMPMSATTLMRLRLPLLVWMASLALWLGVAYTLEFQGEPWAINALQWCGSYFFVAQMWLISSFF